MSGHNKWSKIKNQKAGTDKEKGKLYTFHARKIAAALKNKIGLEQAVEAARGASVPKHVIDRALKKNSDAESLKELVYEGLLAGGKIYLMIATKTDNSTRVSNQIRNILEKNGGKLGEPGSVAYMFEKQGIFYVKKSDDNINLILESGAEDYFEEEDEIRVQTDAATLKSVVAFFAIKNVEIFDEEIVYTPLNLLSLDQHDQNQLNEVLSSFDLIDDIQAVYTNAEN